MKHTVNHSSTFARTAAVALLLAATTSACSDGTTPTTQVQTAGAGQSGGVGGSSGSGGSGGSGGSSGAAGGGTAAVTGGAGGSTSAGAAGTGTAGNSAGSSGAAGMAGSAGSAGSAGAAGSGGGGNDGWVPLFNGTDLDDWTPYGSNAAALFTVENGEIHVYPTQQDQSDQPEANLVHDKVLGGKYTLHVEYKWGEARFGPRKQTDRDAGILFHISGTVSKVWPDSIECQLGSSPVSGEWTSGDLWVLGGPTTAEIKNGSGQLQAVTKNGDFGFFGASEQAEVAHGQWNIVEVIVDGAAEATYMVNGKKVNAVYNMKYSGQPLSEGRISVQAEYAELFYRNIKYKLNQ